MKINWNKKYTTIAIYVCIVAAIAVAAFYLTINFKNAGSVIGNIQKILNPLIIGFIIAYLFNPLMCSFEGIISRFTERKKKHPALNRTLSIIITYLVYAVVILLIVWLIIPQVIVSYKDLLTKIEDYIASLESFLRDLSQTFPFIDIEQMLTYIQDILSDSYLLIQSVTPYVTSFFAGLAEHLKNAFLGIVLSVYFLYSKERLCAQIKKTMYAFTDREKGDKLINFIHFTDDTFGGFIIGKLLDSLIIFILTFIVLAIFKMPYYQLVSVIVGVTNIIPFFGPFIGAIPSAFIIFIADPSKALWFIVIIIIIQQLDGNVIGPKILGETTGLSSLGVIIAITVMSGLLGVVGMFIGVPLFALIYALFDKFVTKKIEEKGNKEIKESDGIQNE